MAGISPLTMAEHYDRQRRLLGQIPPIDSGSGIAGAQPIQFPFPTTANLQDMNIMAQSWVSRKVPKMTGDTNPMLIPIPAQTDNGPYALPLWNIAPVGSVNEVRRTAWIDSTGGQEQMLNPDNRDNLDRNRMSVMTSPPSTPSRTWIESGALMIWPAPSSEGILSLLVGRALNSRLQQGTTEVVPLIPNDFVDIIDYKVVSLIVAQQPDDQVMSELGKRVDRDLMELLDDLKSMVATRNSSYEARMIAQTSRSGLMRTRR